MSVISSVKAREIIDSRGNPTVEVDVVLENSKMGRAAVPSGASTGTLEACELRDGDKSRYNGKGVLKAVNSVNSTIAKELIGKKVDDQKAIDQLLIELDGTKNKSNLGANAILGVSLAAARANAENNNMQLFESLGGEKGVTMPVPMMNIINGGEHANNSIDIQEFMIMPTSASSINEAIRMGSEVFHSLKKILDSNGFSTSVGDEGGFAPNLKSSEEAIEYILKAIEQANYKPDEDIVLALDSASTEFYDNGVYNLKGEGKKLSNEELVEYYSNLISKYPIYSIEDAMSEDDHDGWAKITQKLGKKVQLVGDDLFVTNPEILKNGIENGLANSILIKVNQIGTLTETLDAISMAKDANYNSIISHRSGETEDSTISHIAVATNAGQIKTGSLCRSDRLAKYNELIRIAEKLGDKATYLGKGIFNFSDI